MWPNCLGIFISSWRVSHRGFRVSTISPLNIPVWNFWDLVTYLFPLWILRADMCLVIRMTLGVFVWGAVLDKYVKRMKIAWKMKSEQNRESRTIFHQHNSLWFGYDEKQMLDNSYPHVLLPFFRCQIRSVFWTIAYSKIENERGDKIKILIDRMSTTVTDNLIIFLWARTKVDWGESLAYRRNRVNFGT